MEPLLNNEEIKESDYPTKLHRVVDFDGGDKFIINYNIEAYPLKGDFGEHDFQQVQVTAVLCGNVRDEYAVYVGGSRLTPWKDESDPDRDYAWKRELIWIAQHGIKLTFKDAQRHFRGIHEQFYRR